jgi:hypothetical protein
MTIVSSLGYELINISKYIPEEWTTIMKHAIIGDEIFTNYGKISYFIKKECRPLYLIKGRECFKCILKNIYFGQNCESGILINIQYEDSYNVYGLDSAWIMSFNLEKCNKELRSLISLMALAK